VTTLQIELVARLGGIGREEEIALRPRHRFQPEMAKLSLFDRNLGKVADFGMDVSYTSE